VTDDTTVASHVTHTGPGRRAHRDVGHAGWPVVEVDFFDIVADEQHGLAVFVNIGRDDFCAWADDDFEGSAPVAGLVPAMVKETGQGALVGSLQADVPIELWQVDPDVPPFLDPCVDTDEQAGPWATGQVRWTGNDNDFDASLTRTNVFGGTIRGTVVDVEGGTWRYLNTFRLQIDQNDEFRFVVDKFNLTPIG
jgi:hypothetical protein